MNRMILKGVKRIPKFMLFGLIIICLLVFKISRAADERLLIYASGQTTFFTEHEYDLKWIRAEDTWPEMDDLVIRVITANKTLLQQHLPARFPIQFKLRCPELRPGIFIDATITISAYSRQQLQPGVYSRPVRFYAEEQPFLAQGIGASDLAVIDKTPDKRLVKMLQHFKIPFTPVNRLTDLPYKWILCAGLNFSNNSLFDGLYSFIGKGHSVLILSPVKGKFYLPPFAEDSRITLADKDIISDMNKHLNLRTAGRPIIQGESYQFKMVGGKPGIEIMGTSDGFGWVELRRHQGKMIFCGYNLFNIYDDNPSVGLMITDLLKGKTGNQ